MPSNSLPEKFAVKSQQSKERNHFPLPHKHTTTTDFFKLQPVVCRKVEPNDSMNVDITSFVRLFPMPFPVLGRIRYYNRCFFVPYRQIMEGFNDFIDDAQTNTSSGFIKIQSVPWFYMKDLASVFRSSAVPVGAFSTEIDSGWYWRSYNGTDYLVTREGKIVVFYPSGSTAYYMSIVRKDGELYSYFTADLVDPVSKFGYDSVGTYTVNNTNNYFTITPTGGTAFKFYFTLPSWSGYVPESDYANFYGNINDTSFDDVKFDFVQGSNYYRFTNAGRYFYTILCSLGYRVDFRSSNSAFTSTRKLSAGKLLAFLKVYLDWYSPSQYSETDSLRLLFRGVSSTGKQLSTSDLAILAANIGKVCYDRDYFTGAFQNPVAPNVALSSVNIPDITVENTSSSGNNSRSRVTNTSNFAIGTLIHTPVLIGERDGNAVSNTPYNASMYIIDQLRALTNSTYRMQLVGNRVVDRYLAKYGIKLNDDRVNRCYYIGGYSYDADIMDIMSTADTPQGALGDYAGKGIAYSDAHRSFHFESDEHGFIIVLSSVVPEVGYVQGVDRENLQLDRLQFFDGDFDNLGTQAQTNDELFSDYGMPAPNGIVPTGGLSGLPAPDGVRGFVPRYIEEKIGRDFLTGDFAIPSRRSGMDAFHLFRLFNGYSPSINKDFLIGEQEQYDRIFNNIDSDYDHMYVNHFVMINAERNMKSVNDVYDFEHSDGKDIKVDANGTQLN